MFQGVCTEHTRKVPMPVALGQHIPAHLQHSRDHDLRDSIMCDFIVCALVEFRRKRRFVRSDSFSFFDRSIVFEAGCDADRP